MSRGAAKLLSFAGLIPVFIAALLTESATGLAILLFPIGIAMILVGQYNLRCPHCGAWPRKGSIMDRYCPRCGCDLDDE